MSVSPDAPFPPHEYYSAFPAQPSAQKYQYLAALGYQHFGFEFPSCRMLDQNGIFPPEEEEELAPNWNFPDSFSEYEEQVPSYSQLL
ncbi:hypothetical protein QR680_002903 [Steinernema hermaphroditum]|uniref:Uncharacterized protein n=1 Tax=Steinernema hermaphroditum TaxID=289476 RepID=A0AA39H4K6_9BILA|nr:hypothetical protein QR680_002903 [Steinernema hermaphroditum]